MPGLDKMHHLAIELDVLWNKLAPKVEAEVDKLGKANFIREVQYPIWLANLALVKEKNGQI